MQILSRFRCKYPPDYDIHGLVALALHGRRAPAGPCCWCRSPLRPPGRGGPAPLPPRGPPAEDDNADEDGGDGDDGAVVDGCGDGDGDCDGDGEEHISQFSIYTNSRSTAQAAASNNSSSNDKNNNDDSNNDNDSNFIFIMTIIN